MFMGFGYNPRLYNPHYNPALGDFSGERLDMLDFFAWMKRLQDSGVQAWTIWDASGFAIVNKFSDRESRVFSGLTSGKAILEVLINEQDNLPKRADFKVNGDYRARYLKRLIAISGINGRYVDSRTVFRKDPAYATAVDAALEYVSRLKIEDPRLVDRIMPKKSNAASDLYLPLELAEALYFENKSGIRGKFGPKTERFFDACILLAQERREIPYVTMRSPLSPRRAAYLFDENVLWTRSPIWYDLDLLERDIPYRRYVEGYLRPFQEREEPLFDCVLRMKQALRGDVE